MNPIISAIVLALMLQGLKGPAKIAGTAKLAGGVSGSCSSLPFSDSLIGSGSLGSNWTNIPASGYVAAVRGATGAVSTTGTGAGFANVTCIAFPTVQSAQATIVSPGGDATGICTAVNSAGDAVACFIGLADVDALAAGAGGGGFACPITSPQVSGDTFKITSTTFNGATAAITVTDVTRSTTVCSGATGGGAVTGTPTPGFIVDQRTSSTGRISNFVAD